MSTITLLVVDDSEDDRMLYRRVLAKNKDTVYEMLQADNGEDGLAQIEEHSPHCVLLDYSLPGRNGLEVLKRIRSRHPHLPVVMLTGQGNEKVAVNAMQEGAQNYIAKSNITPESLERVIRIAMDYCAMHKRIDDQRTSLEIFTRALAHDLKEPIRTIRSFLDLIAMREQLSERGLHYFTYIQNAAERMNNLIDTVYFYTRLDGGEQTIDAQECDMAELLDEVKANIGALIRERSAVITTENMPHLRINRMQLTQVFQNLICNAIRHCEQHAPIIHIRAHEDRDQWLFRVHDNGPGINEDYSEKIFEPFKRMSRQKEQGLGLGLAICRKIIEAHQGKIWYETGGQAGATFLFTLPKNNADFCLLPMANPKTTYLSNDAKLGTVLLVEDNEADIELTRIMLLEESQMRCNLRIARSGDEALVQLKDDAAQTIDLILLDINMPGMDGFGLLKRLQDSTSQHPPIIMCSTSSYDKDIEKARALGASGYITKPAEIGKLKSIIAGLSSVKLQQDNAGYTLMRAA